MKHTKEFYVLMAITAIIPITIAILFIAFNYFISSYAYPYDNANFNATTVTFNLTQKSYTSDRSGTFIHGDRFSVNRTELDSMEFDHRYVCNLTRKLPFDLNNSLSDCREL
jgi:hypothetical protein